MLSGLGSANLEYRAVSEGELGLGSLLSSANLETQACTIREMEMEASQILLACPRCR